MIRIGSPQVKVAIMRALIPAMLYTAKDTGEQDREMKKLRSSLGGLMKAVKDEPGGVDGTALDTDEIRDDREV